MGFFSSIKKLWSDASDKPAAPERPASPLSEGVPVEEAAPESEETASAAASSAVTPGTAPLPEPAAESVTEAVSAPGPVQEEPSAPAIGAEREPEPEASAPEAAVSVEDAASVSVPEPADTPEATFPPGAGAPAAPERPASPLSEAVPAEEAAPEVEETGAASLSQAASIEEAAPESAPEPERAGSAAEPSAVAPEPERGFFSAIKRLWSDTSDKPAAPERPASSPSAPGPETVSGVEPSPRPAASAAPTAKDDPQAALTLKLREAEPRLSVWLGIVLEGVDRAGDLLWERLRFLLGSLEAPADEVEAFVADFRGWLERMEYEYVEEFRSELQYRLALALELEDEEDERSRLFLKLSEGLARTREQFSRRLDALFSAHGALDDAFWEEMEELFIMADVGYEPATLLVERLRERARAAGVKEPSAMRELLQAELEEVFRTPRRISAVNPPEVVLMIGVNGVGKTTTIAKLAHRDRMQGKKVLIAAADTFRAAATEQLGVWAARVGADFHAKNHGADPAAVAYEAMDRAVAGGYDVLYVDTAGRLQTKVNLMEELSKIRNVLGKKHPGAPHRSILVIDATTGQNALSQTKLFKEAAGVDELIVTKLDGTAKGGVAIAVAMQFEVPITYVGLGEKLEDLRPFNGADYAAALLGARSGAEEKR